MSANEVWTIKRMLDWMVGYLTDHGDNDAQVSSRWLISNALDMTRTELFLNFDRPISSSELDILRENVKRRSLGEPLQYITGFAPFRHIEVKVKPNVLIPRPETEVLVSEVLKRLPARKYNVSDLEAQECKPTIRIAEIGAGSGCIACSLAYEHHDIEVFATEISSDAVSLSRENAEVIGVTNRVHIIEGDLDEGLEGSFDVIVSNPPYIPTGVLEEISAEVTDYEPFLALDGGEDGLDIFRRIAAWAEGSLNDGGFLACELHETTLDHAAIIAKENGLESTQIIKDLADRPRVLIAQRSRD